MAPQSLADLIAQDPRRALIVILIQLALLGLVALHRHLSNVVGNRPQPAPGERWSLVWAILGFISGAVWKNAEGSTKPIFSPMPQGTLTPEGGFRSGDTDPRISGQFPRVPGPVLAVLLIGCLCLSAAGCASTALDKARVDYANALKVTTAVQTRFRAQVKQFETTNIQRIGVHTPAAVAWLGAFKVKRQPVLDQITHCQEIMDDASDLLLLADDVKGVAAAKNATACASSLRDMVAQLFDGGL